MIIHSPHIRWKSLTHAHGSAEEATAHAVPFLIELAADRLVPDHLGRTSVHPVCGDQERT